MKWYTYLLIDPRTDRPFYVGKGQRNRINAHHQEARRGHKCPKCRKIRKLWQQGRDYTRLIVFRSDDERDAFDLEVRLIAGFRARGVVLCNLTDGGEGVSGYSPPAAIRAQRSVLLKAAYTRPEVKARHLEAVRAFTRNPAYRVRQSQQQRARLETPEGQAQIERARAGMRRPEVRARQGAAARARWRNPAYRIKSQAAIKAARSTPEARAQARALTVITWANPDVRAKRIAGTRAALARPEVRARLSELMRARLTPEYRAKMSRIQKARASTPEGRAQILSASKIGWSKNRVARIQKIKAAHSTPAARARQATIGRATWSRLTPEERARRNRMRADSSSRAWADPIRRARHIAALDAARNRPEVREKHRAAVQAASNRPEVRAKRSQIANTTWADPEVRARRSAAQAIVANTPEERARRSAVQKAAWADPEKRTARIEKMRAARAAKKQNNQE